MQTSIWTLLALLYPLSTGIRHWQVQRPRVHALNNNNKDPLILTNQVLKCLFQILMTSLLQMKFPRKTTANGGLLFQMLSLPISHLPPSQMNSSLLTTTTSPIFNWKPNLRTLRTLWAVTILAPCQPRY